MQLDALPPGARLGDLTVVSRLGQGGMAVVFEARDERLGRSVALKVPSLSLLQDPTARARFEREVRASARLSHPNVVTVFGVADAGGWPYLVLELMKGGSLRDRLKTGGRLPWAQACALTREVALGLEAIHAAGLVHRDLKPENVLFDGQGRAKISDLGLVRGVPDSSDLTRTGQLLGTKAYLAPEQIDQARGVGPSADLYSLGCLLHELIAGAPPFPGSGYDVITKHLRAEPPRLRDVPAPLAKLALSLLAKSPEERPASARAVVEALDALLAQPSSSPSRARMSVGLAVGLAAGVALTAVGVAWVLTRGRVDEPRPAPTTQVAPTETTTAVPPPIAATPPTAKEPASAVDRPSPPPPTGDLYLVPEGEPLKHADNVFSVGAAPDEGVVSIGERGMLRLWRRGSLVTAVKAQTHSPFLAAAGNRVVTHGRQPDDRTINVWALEGDAIRHVEKLPELVGGTKVWSIALSQEGHHLLVGSNDGEVVLVDLRTEERRVLVGAGRAPELALSGRGDRAFAGDNAGRLLVWDLSQAGPTPAQTIEVLSVTPGPTSGVLAIAASEDGGLVLTGNSDGTISWIDLAAPGAPRRTVPAHAKRAACAALSPDGLLALTADDGGDLILWEVRTGQRLDEVSARAGRVWSVVFLAERLAACSAGEAVRLWSIASR